MGTNNGKGSFYLLWQHVAALGRKSLKGVRVFSDSGKSYHMMFEFDALTPTEPGTDPDVPERPPCNPETSWEIVMWVKPENFDEVTRDLPKDDDTETYTPKGAGGVSHRRLESVPRYITIWLILLLVDVGRNCGRMYPRQAMGDDGRPVSDTESGR